VNHCTVECFPQRSPRTVQLSAQRRGQTFFRCASPGFSSAARSLDPCSQPPPLEWCAAARYSVRGGYGFGRTFNVTMMTFDSSVQASAPRESPGPLVDAAESPRRKVFACLTRRALPHGGTGMPVIRSTWDGLPFKTGHGLRGEPLRRAPGTRRYIRPKRGVTCGDTSRFDRYHPPERRAMDGGETMRRR
jgi:hypothetical protein